MLKLRTVDGDVSIAGNAQVSDDDVQAFLRQIGRSIHARGLVATGGIATALAIRGLIVRLTPDGSLDTRFGDGGRLLLDREPSYVSSLVVMPDGEVIAGGAYGDAALLMRFPPP